jgi:hypothetical protein
MFSFWTKAKRIAALEREVIDLWQALGAMRPAPVEKLVLKPSRKPRRPFAGARCGDVLSNLTKESQPCGQHVKKAGDSCRYHRTIVSPIDMVQSTNGVV